MENNQTQLKIYEKKSENNSREKSSEDSKILKGKCSFWEKGA